MQEWWPLPSPLWTEGGRERGRVCGTKERKQKGGMREGEGTGGRKVVVRGEREGDIGIFTLAGIFARVSSLLQHKEVEEGGKETVGERGRDGGGIRSKRYRLEILGNDGRKERKGPEV